MTTKPEGRAPQEEPGHDEWVRSMLAQEKSARDLLEAAELAKRRQAIGIPARFLALAMGDGLRDTEALAEVKRGDFGVLVLAGDVGRGKTVAASWWLLEAVQQRRTPLFVTGARLSRWDRYNTAEMDRLLLASRLVVDDLGEEFNDTKGNFLAVLDETVCDRVANNRPTVITTNLNLEVFTKRYGIRIRDRIKESGRWQSFAGESMRGAA